MTFTYMLFIWTVVAGGGNFSARDWRPTTEFATKALCEEAARELNIEKRYRCVKTK